MDSFVYSDHFNDRRSKPLKIGIAGPATLRLLRGIDGMPGLPDGYDNPGISALVNALLDKGHEVVLFTTSVGMDAPAVFSAKALTVCVARRGARAGRSLFRLERRELVMLMRQYPVDIINAHWSYEFAWAALDSNFPTLVTIRDYALAVFKYKRDMYRFIRLAMNQYVLNRARFISVNSLYLFGKLTRKHQRKAKVIPNFFAPETMSKFNEYNEREHVIVSVVNGFGRLKNVGTALRAFSILRKTWPGLRYRLIGVDMENGGAAERYALSSNLAGGIEFLGKLSLERTLDYVRSAKLLLHPSLEESFGMCVLEAMVVGTPVIGGSQSGNIPSLLDRGRAGILCDVLNPEAMARAASEILLDRKRAESLATAAAKYAQNTFLQETIVSAYLDYYSEILVDCNN